VDSLSYFYKGFIVRTDTSGSILFSNSFSSSRPEFIQDIKVLNLNSYVIVLDQAQPSAYNFTKIVISDSIGSISKEKIFSAHTYSFFNTALPLLNGDLIFVGEARRIVDLHSDFYAVRTDSSLNYIPISISPISSIVPEGFKLYQNYPNPFNPSTRIRFDIGQTGNVKLSVFDVLGKEIKILANENLSAGSYEIEFHAENLPSGIYFYQLKAEGKVIQTQKMVLIR
jgi:hypothetical protein